MAIQLTQPDFDRLVGMLQMYPDWQTVQGRVDVMSDVFAASPRKYDLIGSLNLDGTPRAVAIRTVTRLSTFGQDEAGRESLGVLVNKMLTYLGGGDDADFLKDLLTRSPFTTPPVAVQPITETWKGTDTPETTAEKIIGENTLRDIFMLEALLDASCAVVRIEVPQVGVGTGFMVAEDLVMTNHHVLPSRAKAEHSTFTFNYQLERSGQTRQVQTVRMLQDGMFYTSKYNPARV